MSGYLMLAPAKVNLGLFVGPTREADGRHELVTVMQSISLADELRLEPAARGTERDELFCPGLPGRPEENLAARALASFRAATGWDAPPLKLSIDKRIPVAAGLGGGSADAAAALRLAHHASGLGDEALLLALAAELGADVPAQVVPGRWLATGAGELLQALPDPLPALQLLVLPSSAELSTAAVYREADELGLAREQGELGSSSAPSCGLRSSSGRRCRRRRASCCTTISRQRPSRYRRRSPMGWGRCERRARRRRSSAVLPTVIGLFGHANPAGRGAQRAAAALGGEVPEPIAARSVDAEFAKATRLS